MWRRPQKILNHSASTSWASIEHREYLAQMNHSLINQITQVETEKHFYKNKLSKQNRTHQSQLEEAFKVISEKNQILVNLQEKMDRQKKQNRMLSDDFICLKNNYEAEKEFHTKQIINIKLQCQQKIKKIEQQCKEKVQQIVSQRVAEVYRQCEDRIKLFKDQIAHLTENSKNLLHELQYLQEQYRQMLAKNDTIIQESIYRQLRKRDFQAQNNYLRDLAQNQSLKKQRNQLKQRLEEVDQLLNIQKKENNLLQSQNQTLKTRVQNMEQTLTVTKQENKELLKEKYVEKSEFQTNTEQPFVPIIMPVDMNLMAEIISLKDFITQKITERFLQFYCKTAVIDPKKKSNSVTSFTNCLRQLSQSNPQNRIMLYFYTSIERIVKLYCPTLSYQRQYVTIKDQFIKKVINECDNVSNEVNKVYRLLGLLHRCKHPINHLHSQISTEELKLVETKILKSLKNILT